jgi:hypothetical protein
LKKRATKGGRSLACSRSGIAKTRFGDFFLRDFDFGIGDGLLHRRRQLRGSSLLRRNSWASLSRMA